MKNISQIISLLLLIVTIFSCSNKDKGNPVNNDDDNDIVLEWLHVEGNKIINESGEQVILHGVNRSGLEYDNPGGNDMSETEIDHICTEWRANIIRVPFNQEWIMTDDYYNTKLDNVISWIKKNGAYIILDLQWQNTLVGIPNIPDTNAITMWRILAERYKDEPAVLYDIHNETHDIDFASWKSRAIEIIEAIQVVHPKALILVSGMQWASNLQDWANEPLDYENIVYSLHLYPWFGGSSGWPVRFGNYTDDIPIFCGEFGGDETNIQWGTELIRYLNEKNIGWCSWSWVDDPHLTDPYDHITPTPFGELVKSYLVRFATLEGTENAITDLEIRFIGTDKATIQWDTEYESDSKVLYGLTESYTDSVYAQALLTTRTIKLKNLSPNTIYHIKAISIDEFGFKTQSSDTTFQTLSQ